MYLSEHELSARRPHISKAKEVERYSDQKKNLNIKAANHDHMILSLSGGNQQKVFFGRWLNTDAEILLLDNPTQGIDVGAKAEIYLLLIAIFMIYLTTSTKYGKRLFAIGSNVKAAHMAGINVARNRVSVYTITGLLVGIAAVMWLAMQGNVDPATTGVGYEMYAIAAVVLGNISMSGGKGHFAGIIFGTLSYTIIDKIIAAIKVDSLINNAIKGMILIIAIVIQICGPQIRASFINRKPVRHG